MSRNTKIALAVVAGLLLLCLCGGGIAAYFALRSAGQVIEQAVVVDPTEVGAIATGIAEYNVPPGYDEQFGMSLLGFDLVALGRADEANRGEFIMLMQMPSSAGLSQAEMEAQLRQTTQQQLGNQNVQFEMVDQVTTSIRDAQVTLTISEGRADDGLTYRQMSGVFPGKDGPTLLMIHGPAQSWDQAEVDAFIESIR